MIIIAKHMLDRFTSENEYFDKVRWVRMFRMNPEPDQDPTLRKKRIRICPKHPDPGPLDKMFISLTKKNPFTASFIL